MTITAERLAEMRRTMLLQIGNMNLLAISGGRFLWLDDMLVKLPVGAGYSVEVEYDFGSDTYTVRRVFTRKTRRWVKGERTNVYFDELGETAYRASSFRSYEFP